LTVRTIPKSDIKIVERGKNSFISKRCGYFHKSHFNETTPKVPMSEDI